MRLVLFLSDDDLGYEVRLETDWQVAPRIGERINWDEPVDGELTKYSGRITDVHWDVSEGYVWLEVADVEVWHREPLDGSEAARIDADECHVRRGA